MLLITKPLICPSRSRSAGGPGFQSGYALLLVMLAATLLLLSLTAALPSISQEGQREREEELIFRGTQYARAIAGFHQQIQRYPISVQELTKLTNGMRFLRKEYADPMTPKGEWRFVHANGQGVLLDSKTQGPGSGGQGQPGSNQSTGGFGTSSQSGMGGSAFGQSTGGFSLDSNPGGSTPSPQQNSAFFGEGNQGGGTFIVGVASTSHKQSIRSCHQKTHYDEWEFLGIDLGNPCLGYAVPGLPQGVGGQPGQGGQPPQGNATTPAQPQSMFPPSGGSTFSQQ